MPQSPDPVIDPVIDPEPGGGRALGTATYIKSLDWVSDARLYRLAPPMVGGEYVVAARSVALRGPDAGRFAVLVGASDEEGGSVTDDPDSLEPHFDVTHEEALLALGYEVVGGPLVVGLDPALLRPGRFDEVLRTDVPGEAYRREVIGFYCKKFGVRYRKGMVADMVGFTPADIREVLLTTGIVGADVYDAELERVKLQRGLYSEEKMAEFAMRKR